MGDDDEELIQGTIITGHVSPAKIFHTCMLNCFSHVQFFATSWTIAHQSLVSIGIPHGLQLTSLLFLQGFSRQEYWGGLPCPSPGYLPDAGIEPAPLMFLPLAPPANPKYFILYPKRYEEIVKGFKQRNSIFRCAHQNYPSCYQ